MTSGKTRRPRPKRALGQNFLVDPNIQRKIVRELDPQPADAVLEVGPGHGELSQYLVGRCRRLVLIEKDRDLAGELRERWGDRRDVDVVEGDALRLGLPDFVGGAAAVRVVSNVPYNITSPLVFAFLELEPAAIRIVLTVQREVAERIVAPPGIKAYGALSVGVQALADASLAFRVSRQAFRPVPAVDSAVVRLEPRPDAADVDRAALRTLTRACFNRRRKQLQKTLRTAPELKFAGDAGAVLMRLSIDPAVRPETLDPPTFVRLAAALQAGKGGGAPR
ncbi:MAG: ribosomal RNA small subunit methyltransferase A [Gemmatimonadales bacterium]|nr:ribosomal RNA small subunit methyltransferase A [Gemmatimonadales bacterium]MYG48229.1 ribosomal RNA small subunit methyltransferase A [Gemmatimonadales bacterium]MYK01139.1 ribosomal RNA small subunit methyltransferase A [Candidatus Palauibacter ramosifaciens]